MALVLLCGNPCSGKSWTAQRLAKYFKESQDRLEVEVLDEDSLHLPTNVDTVVEKQVRGAFRSAVQRHVNSERIVLCDYTNFIKGFRYELFCVGKNAQVKHCLVHCDEDDDVCRRRNEAGKRYTKQQLEDLLTRFERPDPTKKWDSRYFRSTAKEPVDGSKVLQFIQGASHVKQSIATVMKEKTSADYMNMMDHVIKEVTRGLVQHMASPSFYVGSPFQPPHGTQRLVCRIKAPKSVILRTKKQFMALAREQKQMDESEIADRYVAMLQQILDQ